MMTVPPPAEVVFSRGLVRTLLTDQHPDLADREIAEPLEGFDMAMFRLGEDLAVRLPRHRGAAGSLESELRWVGALSDRWTFPTQRIVRSGVPGAGFPWCWAVTSWLPGELAADRPLAAPAAPEMGRALAEIHRPAPADAPFNSEQSVRLAEREPILRDALPRLPSSGAARGLTLDPDAVAALWNRALAVPDEAPRVWIHGDLHPFNVISRNGAFGGIIDWSDIARGDPAVDLGFLRLLFPAADMPAAHEAYGGVDEATAARALGIGLVKAALLATVPKETVADIGWRTLVELGVANRTAPGGPGGPGSGGPSRSPGTGC
ncbi:phosphotransferase [Nocardiopsis sp. N85]|uniref:phosphotransferase n=1 Tax=Nocardiopsis sp. N85 TaxID=3029400 RepID=UPI00237F3243|nr:phosphotransferase [Nocardiopsis sp. N85]MDE3723667.1 phosphotransferase [Nocardiopsis sp. N85]